jgi:hypothetical protein
MVLRPKNASSSIHLEGWALLVLRMPATRDDLFDFFAVLLRNWGSQILDPVLCTR